MSSKQFHMAESARTQGEYGHEPNYEQLGGWIMVWMKKHYDETVQWKKQRDELRASKTNATASTEDKSMQHAVNMPSALFNVLERISPGFLSSQRRIQQFCRQFPIFKIAEKV